MNWPVKPSLLCLKIILLTYRVTQYNTRHENGDIYVSEYNIFTPIFFVYSAYFVTSLFNFVPFT